jgi:acetyl-CoA C-acetyltransferase
MSELQNVYIVDGARTPFLKAKKGPNPLSGSDLAVQATQHLLLKQPFEAHQFDNVVVGCTLPSPEEANIARIVGLRVGCGDKVPAWTVMRNCASGLQAIDSAATQIMMGKNNLVLAGGTDAMSQAPLLFNRDMTVWFAEFVSAKTWGEKLALIPKLRPHFLAPVIAILKGLTDSVVGINMGQTAENVAYRFNITRQEMDEYALLSHQRLANAQDKSLIPEITPVFDDMGTCHTVDDGLRRETTLEKLGKLKPFFDKKFGRVTAGNSSQITDGAAMLVLASAQAVKKYKLPVLARIVDVQWAALDPAMMGLGPVHAITPMLTKHGLKKDDIHFWEINEAFAAQVLGCLRAWEDIDYCRDNLGLDKAFGRVPLDRVNIDGGAIAIGHPVGASGARITLHLANILKREKARYGVASLCIGGGQGGAILIENVDGVQ